MSSTIRIALGAALLALAVGSGTSHAGPPPAGGKTVTLTLANPEPRGGVASQIAEAFAARAKALSKGKVVVKIVYEAGRTSQNLPFGQLEANLIRLVRTGKAEIAVVPSRAFQAQGVTSFQALQAPFLITTDAGMAKVTTGSIATQLQSGLGRIGLVGLGLAPEGLRRPFGFKRPLLSPAAFAGSKIRAIPSKQTWALLRALGAKPVDLSGDDFTRAVENGSVKGAESSLAIAANDTLLRSAFTAGNVAFFPKIDALVSNSTWLKSLTPEQVSILRDAAVATRSWAVATLTEQAARNAFCRSGGTIVNGFSSSIRKLRAKAAPVLAAMRGDARTRSLIAQIEPLGSAGSGVAPCSHKTGGGNNTGPTVTKLIPAGVYRTAVTEQELLAAGATPTDAIGNAGTWTLTTTTDGYQQIDIDSPYPEWTASCNKRKMYLRDGLVAIELRGLACNGDTFLAWRLVADGIEFTRVVPNDAVNRILFRSGVWRKIG